MPFLLVATVVLFMTGGTADGIQCYQCKYDNIGVGMACQTMTNVSTLTTIECPSACQTSVSLQSDGSIFTLSRGCDDGGSANCCQNLNTQMRCIQTCSDGAMCNGEPYTSTSSINSLSRCPVSTTSGSISCNSCQYSGGNPDQSCLNAPLSAKVAVVSCPVNSSECTVKSMRPIGDQTSVWSFERGCHPKGSMAPYGRTIDSIYITWICHCQTDNCNDNIVDGTSADCHPTTTTSGHDIFSLGFSPIRQRNYIFVMQAVTIALFKLISLCQRI